MRQQTATDSSDLFNFLPMPLLEFNLSAVKNFAETLIGENDTGLKQIVEQRPETADEMIGKGELLAANRAALELYEAAGTEHPP
jgi:hypothetical protein